MGAGWANTGRYIFSLRIILFVKAQKRRGSRLLQGEDDYMTDQFKFTYWQKNKDELNKFKMNW